MQKLPTLLALLLLGTCALRAQTLFEMPFELPRPHIDVEIHHPADVKYRNVSLFEGMYVFRAVVPIDDGIQIAAEQSFGSWSVPSYNGTTYHSYDVGNTVITGNFMLDITNSIGLRTSLALPLFNDGAQQNVFADPWHVYRYAEDALAVIVEGTGAWKLTPEFYAAATAGLEFYKYIGSDSVTDD